MPEAKLESIWIKRFRRGPMDPSTRATLKAGSGIVGNSNQGGHRQVTVISVESWRELTAELGAELDPSVRRANFLVSGVDLVDSRGRVLRIGACRLRIRGETRPCHLMEETHPGLEEAMKPGWRGGVYGEVLNDAEVAVEDEVRWLNSSSPAPAE